MAMNHENKTLELIPDEARELIRRGELVLTTKDIERLARNWATKDVMRFANFGPAQCDARFKHALLMSDRAWPNEIGGELKDFDVAYRFAVSIHSAELARAIQPSNIFDDLDMDKFNHRLDAAKEGLAYADEFKSAAKGLQAMEAHA